MKGLIVILIALFYCNTIQAQIEFEKGYFIDNDGNKTECLIKNQGWKNNPDKFEYKLEGSTEIQSGSLQTTTEFAVPNKFKFRRFNVKIDLSGNDLYDLSNNPNPEFSDKILFLRTLVEGAANLYQFTKGTGYTFFFSVNNSDVTPLIYKKYLTDEDQVAINAGYKRQLWELKCDSILSTDISKVEYSRRSLTKYFSEHNTCIGSEYFTFEGGESKGSLNLYIRPGIRYSTLVLKSTQKTYDFGNNVSFILGIEAEFILPFRNKKWAITIEPTYQHFSSNVEVEYGNIFPQTTNLTVTYNSIELPIGIRYFFFLNENNKLFFNGVYCFDFSFNSSMDYEASNLSDLKVEGGSNFAFGLGFNHNNRVSLEIRYGLPRNILAEFYVATTDYKTLSMLVGYNFLAKQQKHEK